MTKKALTQTQIRNIKGNGKIQRFSLGNKLFLFVQPSGKLSYRYCYRLPVTNVHKVKHIGDPLLMSLNEALSIALSYNLQLSQGIDPFEVAEKKANEEKKQQITLREIAEDWQITKGGSLQPRTLRDRIARFKRYLLPILGDVPISEIELADAREKIKPIYFKVPHIGEKVARDLRNLADHAVEMGILSANHLQLIKKSFPRPPAENNPCITPEELPEFLRTLNRSSLLIQTRLLIEFELLTMVRADEVVTAEWSEVDFSTSLWHIPKEKMKGGKKPHSVPLSRQALEVLKEMRNYTGHKQYIFAGRTVKNPHYSSNTANQAFKKLGYKDRMTPHGMRSLARTYLADQGVPFEVAEACLSHTVGSQVAKTYNKSTYLEQRKEAMQLWGDFVEQCKKN